MPRTKQHKKGKRNGKGKSFSEEKSNEERPTFRVVRGPILPKKDLKFIDNQFGSNLDTTGTLTLINGIAEGDDYNSRNSRSVVIKSVAVRGNAFPTATTGLPQKARIMLVWDNAVNGALPTIATILATVNAESFPLVDNEKRYTILWDHSFVIGLQAAAVADQVIVNFEKLIHLNAPVAFLGTTNGIGSVQNGAIYLVTVGNLVAGTTAGSTLVNTRVRFMENIDL